MQCKNYFIRKEKIKLISLSYGKKNPYNVTKFQTTLGARCYCHTRPRGEIRREGIIFLLDQPPGHPSHRIPWKLDYFLVTNNCTI